MPVARCLYVTKDGRRCASPGMGSPPVCPKHKRYVKEAPNPLVNNLVGILLDQPVTKAVLGKLDVVLDKATATLGKFADGDFSELDSLLRKGSKPTVEFGGPVKENPRVVLGFGPTQELTKQMIKDRKRELAKLMHPDKGGSDEAMQRINEAAEALMKEAK